MSKTWTCVHQLAVELGISYGQMRRLITHAGITPHTGRKNKRMADPVQVRRLRILHHDLFQRANEITLSQAATTLGVTPHAVSHIMRRAGVEARTCGKLRLVTPDQVRLLEMATGGGPPREGEVTSARAAELLGVHMVSLPKLQKRAGFVARNHKQWRIYTLAQIELMRPHIRNRAARDIERGKARTARELTTARAQNEVMRRRRAAKAEAEREAELERELRELREARQLLDRAHQADGVTDAERARKIARIVMMLEDGRAASLIQRALDVDDDMMRAAQHAVSGGAI